MVDPDERTILVVEDERDLANLYTEWLSDEYAVRTAHDGHEAVDLLDDEIDVALLDRRMPDLAGDEVLDEIRNRDLDCRVAMVTAIEPDVDIVDMGFDEYIEKPIDREDLHETIETLLTRASYDDQLQEYYALASKKATLDTQLNPAERETSDEYSQLEQELARLEGAIETTTDDLDVTDFRTMMRDL